MTDCLVARGRRCNQVIGPALTCIVKWLVVTQIIAESCSPGGANETCASAQLAEDKQRPGEVRRGPTSVRPPSATALATVSRTFSTLTKLIHREFNPEPSCGISFSVVRA